MFKWIISIVVIFVASTVFLSIFLQPDDLVGCEAKPTSQVSCHKVDAIVAVSGGDTTARTAEAVNLFKNGWADRLILSGAAEDKAGPSNAAVMKDLAIASGVPEVSISIDESAETTKENAENAKGIFEDQNIKSVILVTSGYHQKRAYMEFEKRTDNVQILNHPVKADNDWSFWWWLTPRGWWLALSELAKIAFLYVAGAIGYE